MSEVPSVTRVWLKLHSTLVAAIWSLAAMVTVSTPFR